MKMPMTVLAVAAAIPSLALGQFVDDFNGNALGAHWEVLQPSYLTYSVSGGMLHVENLHTNHAAVIRTTFNPLSGDVVAHARLGWDAPGVGGQDLTFQVTTTSGGEVGTFTYVNPSGGPGRIQVQTGSTQPVLFTAPAPGMHDFMIERVGNIAHFFLDGSFLASLPTNESPAQGTGLIFGSIFPVPIPFQQFHVDRIEVVPSPGNSVVMVLCAAWMSTRRRG